jgi:hypothetical protein
MNVKEVGVDGFCAYGTEPAISVGDLGAMAVCQQ